MWISYGKNEFGTKISHHICDTCGGDFTVCPARPFDDTAYLSCLGLECDSYDIKRDAMLMFGQGKVKRGPVKKKVLLEPVQN